MGNKGKKSLKKPELLAPAGNWDALVAAVQNGADAVYLGGRSFNARQYAENFDSIELARAVEYAHVRGVKVYITANILLGNGELGDALRFLHQIQKWGADAAIVQDLGLLKLARQLIPELPLHASTQMTVYSLSTARFLKRAGVERIILARELPLSAVKEIAAKSGAEVEVFVHGALCVCYSGQCLMSSLIGGRSGNRGRCAQPCRLNYTLVDLAGGRVAADPEVTGEYLLSTRDLNMSSCLPDLIEAGVSALKIEGRMKRPEYVATVVRVYRSLLDRCFAGGQFYVLPEEAEELAQIFNRGFTTGYFYGRQGIDLMSYKRPNNRGLFLGRVKSYDPVKRQAEVLLDRELCVGDGIEFWVTRGGRLAGEVGRLEVAGHNVERAPAGSAVRLDVEGKVFPGDRVFKTHDRQLVEKARASFASPREIKKFPVYFGVTASLGEPLAIEVYDSEGNRGRAKTDSPVQTAVKRPLTPELLAKQLDRLGNTPYEMASLDCRLDENSYVPVSEINEARRQALDELSKARVVSFRARPPLADSVFEERLSRAFGEGELVRQNCSQKPLLTAAVSGRASLEAAVSAGADEVIFTSDCFRSRFPAFSLQKFTEEALRGAEICKRAGVKFVLASPRILMDGEEAEFIELIRRIKGENLAAVLVTTPGLIEAVREAAGRPVYTCYSVPVFNHQAARFLGEHGASRVTLSPELNLQQIREILPKAGVPAEIIVHGQLTLMVSEYCPAGAVLGGGRPENCSRPCRGHSFGLKDRTGAVFPLEMDRYCRMHLFNSVDLCTVEEIDLLAGLGPAALRIEARRARPEYVRAAVEAYRQALDTPLHGHKKPDMSALKEKLASCTALAGFTRGHLFRGVL